MNHSALNTWYKGRKALVTGGAGFIGSHLVEKLVNFEAQVTVLDNFSTGNLNNLNNVANKITIINQSVTNYDAVLEATRDMSIIFHLAALVSVIESIEQPSECQKNNVDGTFTVLEAARVNQVPNFLFASSSSVYGQQASMCSELTPTAPTSPYGYSKLIGEMLCKEYASVYGLKTIVVRYFNVYGERQNPHGAYAGVVAKFRQQMKDNAPITIFGDGGQKRDFISVHDVVTANVTLPVLQSASGEIFNIGSSKSITLLELFAQLKQEFRSYDLEPIFLPARPGDIYSSQADCSKYHSVFRTFSLTNNTNDI